MRGLTWEGSSGVRMKCKSEAAREATMMSLQALLLISHVFAQTFAGFLQFFIRFFELSEKLLVRSASCISLA
jgi:hypothetical protein